MDKPSLRFTTLYQIRLDLTTPELNYNESSAERDIRMLVLDEIGLIERQLFSFLDKAKEDGSSLTKESYEDLLKSKFERFSQFYEAYDHIFRINHEESIDDFLNRL